MRSLSKAVVGGLALTTLIAASPSYARPVDQWTMKVVDGESPNLAEGLAMTFEGSWRKVRGRVGGAVRFTAATSYGVAHGTRGHNPGSENFAFSETFTSEQIPSGYSGNLMQKGYFTDPGQIKLQLVPVNGGSVDCRIKGTNGAKILHSPVTVDDGLWHTATCFSRFRSIGLTVDGITRKLRWNPGVVSNSRAVRVGNKSSTAGASDQHLGKVDCAVYTIKGAVRRQALSSVPC